MDPDDPTIIDWTARLAAAAFPFQIINGRPVNPHARTGRAGRGGLWHWGEGKAADALVTATTPDGRHVLMIRRSDDNTWAIPGGHIDPGESPLDAAVRELEEEAGMCLVEHAWQISAARYVPDPRATDEAWMVTYLATLDLGMYKSGRLPAVVGLDDAAEAAWIRADSYEMLAGYLADVYGGRVFPAHVGMLSEALAVGGVA